MAETDKVLVGDIDVAKLDDDEVVALYQTLREKAPPPGSLFRHYGGGEYRVTGCRLDCKTLEGLVDYENVHTAVPWSREVGEFLGHVIRPGTKEVVRRFEPVSGPAETKRLPAGLGTRDELVGPPGGKRPARGRRKKG